MMTNINPDKLPEPYRTNIKTWRHTDMICNKLSPLKKDTIKILHDPDYIWSHSYEKTDYIVLPIDTLKAANIMYLKGLRPAILNLADDSFPTGCVATGSTAQEESLCRSSTLSKHIDIKFYPIKDNELLYSFDVVVFKDSLENNYKILDKSFSIDIISCPGLRHPMLLDGCLKDEDINRLRIKIENIFQAAHKNGNSTIVLGALGCGAWKNPPSDVAKVFKEISIKYDGMFKEVVFAILPQDTMQLFAPNEKEKRACNLDIFYSFFPFFPSS